jgi:hypothetical protein
MGKKTSTSEAPVIKLPVAGVRVTPNSGWLVKRTSYTAVKAITIRRATATDDNDEGDIDCEDDIDVYGDDDEDIYGDDDKDDYGHDKENYTDDDGDDATPVAHTSSQGCGQHAATDLRIPRRHSVPHKAPDCLALIKVKQTFDVPHAPTIAEIAAGIEARMSAHMDERVASFETGYKLVMASLATANARGLDVLRTSVRDGGRMTDHISHSLPPHTNVLPVHDTNILPPCITHTLPPHTDIPPVHDTNILPPCITHTLSPHTDILPVHDTNILPPCITHTENVATLAFFTNEERSESRD